MTKAKTILITGCSSGIGHCAAHGLKQRGYRVFATARQAEDVERLKDEGLESFQLDLASSESIRNGVKRLLTETDGSLDALFNNGAYGQPGAVEDLRREVLREQFETNIFGTQELTNLLIPVMRQQGHGRIINNSSILGIINLPYRGAYNASKFALESLSDTLRMELHGSGIHVAIIEPGPIKTKFRANSMTMFQKNIDPKNSAHRAYYEGVDKRLSKPGNVSSHTLPPEAVLEQLIHALESPKPKLRYRVTTPTQIAAVAKRLLPDRWLDWLLRSYSAKENS
ncbi:MAG: SDR family oxidoreductase [Pseudomonadota bacterium]|nr:SDR family oxidoreductase [Pseudomonadota bacterium]